MEKCRACGVEFSPESRFCSNCGALREDVSGPNELTQISTSQLGNSAALNPEATFIQGTPPLPPALNPEATFIQGTPPLPPALNPEATFIQETAPLPPPVFTPGTNPGAATENASPVSEQSGDEEREQRAGLLDLAAPPLLAQGQLAPAPHMPIIQGTPQLSSIPTLPGTPQPAGNATPTFQPPHPQQTGPQLHHMWQQHTGHAASHTAEHAVHTAAGKTVGGFAAKWVIVIIATVVVVAGGAAGALAYVLTRPQPVISITSPYMVGKTPAGSSGTRLRIKGQKFSDNSAITFLLDAGPAPGAPRVSSDLQGNLNTALLVTSAWSTGRHTLTARDAGGNATKVGVLIEIVAQGVANTPGPLGAPPDDASFKVDANINGQYDQGGGPFSVTETEIVTGHPDPAGGSVCQPEDDGQPHQYSSHTLDTGLPETQTYAASCSGTYKAGTLSLTETLLSDVVQLTFDNTPVTCHLLTPGVDEQLTGSYTSQGTFSGTMTYKMFPRTDFSCAIEPPVTSFYFFIYGGSGTWTGTISTS